MIATGFLVVLLQMLDLSAGDTWAVTVNGRVSFDHMILYSTITVASIVIQIFLLMTTTRIIFKIKKPASYFGRIIAFVYMISQIATIILLAYLLAEQLVTSRYHIILSELIIGISLVISVLIMISLAFTCLKSYLSTRSKAVVVYGIAIVAVSVQLIGAFIYVEVSLFGKPQYITPNRNPWASFIYTELGSNLSSIYSITKNISFVAVWTASVILTKSNIHKVGKAKYWLIVSIPVIYFLFQYFPILLDQIGPLDLLTTAAGSILPYFYNFVLNTVNIGSGILFGLSFFILSRAVSFENLKYYLIICGTGIMIIFSSNVSTTVILGTFPAWAIVSLSFVLPASFLLLLGLDSATYYIAGDILVRRFLNKFRNQFDMFAALGSAEASAATERRIHNISTRIHDNLETEKLFVDRTETGDVRQYVREVIDEMRKSGGKDKSDSDSFHNQST